MRHTCTGVAITVPLHARQGAEVTAHLEGSWAATPAAVGDAVSLVAEVHILRQYFLSILMCLVCHLISYTYQCFCCTIVGVRAQWRGARGARRPRGSARAAP